MTTRRNVIRRGARPLYQQVREVLRTQIESGQFPVGQTLPPEMELMHSFNVSRSTIRTALRDLAEERLVKATPGVGTVVIRARAAGPTSELKGISEDLRQKGISTYAKLLDAAFVDPSPFIREHLELPRRERVLRLERLRFVAGTPLAYLVSYVPEFVGLKLNEDFTKPLYQLIERAHDLHIIYGRDVVTAHGAKEHEAERLHVDVGAPVLLIRRTAYIEHDRPVEYVEAAIRGDLYEYTITLPRGKEME